MFNSVTIAAAVVAEIADGKTHREMATFRLTIPSGSGSSGYQG